MVYFPLTNDTIIVSGEGCQEVVLRCNPELCLGGAGRPVIHENLSTFRNSTRLPVDYEPLVLIIVLFYMSWSQVRLYCVFLNHFMEIVVLG